MYKNENGVEGTTPLCRLILNKLHMFVISSKVLKPHVLAHSYKPLAKHIFMPDLFNFENEVIFKKLSNILVLPDFQQNVDLQPLTKINLFSY